MRITNVNTASSTTLATNRKIFVERFGAMIAERRKKSANIGDTSILNGAKSDHRPISASKKPGTA
jgi:hypothetical protein